MENGFHFNFSGNPVVFFFFFRRAGPNIDRKTFIIGKDGSIKVQGSHVKSQDPSHRIVLRVMIQIGWCQWCPRDKFDEWDAAIDLGNVLSR